MSNILVMPGTKWQVKLIEKIKMLGHKVFLVDPNPQCACNHLSDDHFISDIFNIDKIEEYIKERAIDSIISDECDIAIPILAELAERCHLTYIDKEMAALYTNKYAMREFCKKESFPYPEYYLCASKQEAIDLYIKMGCKVIMKPIDCNSSKGVFTVDGVDDIEGMFNESISYSIAEKKIIIERYIEGIEFTVDGIKTQNEYKVLAISQKKHFHHNENIANELFFSYHNAEYDYDELRRINELYVLNSRLPFGFTHAEYKYENGQFFLIEIAARGGGNQISSIIAPYLSGIDTYNQLINWSLGNIESMSLRADENKGRCAVLKFFETPQNGGTVERIEGEDFLVSNTKIKDYSFNFSSGDVIEECKSDSARIGYYIACCENRNELERLMADIADKVKIVMR